MGNCNVIGPNKVMVVNGGPCSNSKKIIVGARGGCAWSWWFCSHVTKLPLNMITLYPKCSDVETKQGVALTVSGVAQVMVDTMVHIEDKGSSHPIVDEDGEVISNQPQDRDVSLMRALEQFSGKTQNQVENTILQTLEGHLRAILGTLTVEQIYTEREAFSARVRATAAADLANMGLKIVSFVIRDIKDEVNYLDSKGQAEVADAIKNADIGRAECDRDAAVVEAKCNAAKESVLFEAKTAIANSERDFKSKQAVFDQEVNARLAEAKMAYSLQAAKVQQKIRMEEVEIEVVERRKQIEIQEQEVLRREKELVAQENRPAEADRFKIETIAEGDSAVTIMEAEAEAESIKLMGRADASRILAVGEAEAEAMRVKAKAFAQYGDAAKLQMILDILPNIAKEIAAPLARVDDIVLLSGENDSGVSGQVGKLMSTLPPVVEAVSGVKLDQALAGRRVDPKTQK